MRVTTQSILRTALYAAIVSSSLACSEKAAVTKPTPEPAASAAPVTKPVTAEPAIAKDILKRMARFLASNRQFSVDLNVVYDALQESGQMIEFGETRTVNISRPNKLRVETEQSDGDHHIVQYDGKTITTYSPLQKVYAQADKPGGIDDALKYFIKDLGMRLPLAILWTSQFEAEIEKRTEELNYVEQTVINGTPVHHLAGRNATVDYQVWVALGEQPLPLRVVLTYKDAEGQPSFRSDFVNWNLKPQFKDSLFTFTPPADASKISFLTQMSNVAAPDVTHPAQTGGQK